MVPGAPDNKLTQHESGSVGILSVANDGKSQIRLMFDNDCGETENNNGQSKDVPSELAGQTVTAHRTADGRTEIDGGNFDQEAKANADEALNPWSKIYPANPVAIGDEWEVAASAQLWEWLNAEGNSRKCKLSKIEDVNGRKTAVINFTETVVLDSGGGDFEGTVRVDLETGVALQVDLTGHMAINMLEGIARIEIHQVASLVGQNGNP